MRSVKRRRRSAQVRCSGTRQTAGLGLAGWESPGRSPGLGLVSMSEAKSHLGLGLIRSEIDVVQPAVSDLSAWSPWLSCGCDSSHR